MNGRKIITYIFIIILAATILFIGFFSFHSEPPLRANQIAFLDVGQGDATLLKMDDDTLILVDCGPDSSILRALSRKLSLWQKTVDYLVITHGDRDHFGGCIDVLKNYRIKAIVTNGILDNDTDPWQRTLVEAIGVEGAQEFDITQPITWHFAGSSVIFLYPDHNLAANPDIPGFAKKAKSNDQSIIMQVVGQRARALLAADAEAPLETYLVKQYTSSTLASSVLKAGHHGSKSSSTELFLKTVRPLTVIISAGAGNRYGHPAALVLARLKRLHIQVRRTDLEGDIVLDF